MINWRKNLSMISCQTMASIVSHQVSYPYGQKSSRDLLFITATPPLLLLCLCRRFLLLRLIRRWQLRQPQSSFCRILVDDMGPFRHQVVGTVPRHGLGRLKLEVVAPSVAVVSGRTLDEGCLADAPTGVSFSEVPAPVKMSFCRSSGEAELTFSRGVSKAFR